MSNEISYSFNLLLKNGSLNDQFASTSKAATQTVANLVRNVQAVPTAAAGTALDLGGVATPGFSVFQNLDAANYIEIGSQVTGVFYPLLKLKFGELVMCRIGIAAPYARANGSAINLFYIIYDD